MKQNRLSSSEKIALEKLRAQVVTARRWHHRQIGALDAAWLGAPGQLVAQPPDRRAIHFELLKRMIAKLTSCVPASAFEAPADGAEVASSAASASEAADQPAT